MLRKNWLLIAIVLLSLGLIGLVVKQKFFSGPSSAALKIETDPAAVVFIDGQQVGSTPFHDDNLEPGEHLVKIVPEENQVDFNVWEKRINLTPLAMTLIDYRFTQDLTRDSGQVISLEKIATREAAALSVISVPGQAVIKINGDPRGFTPFFGDNLAPDIYEITISSTGYEEKTITNAKLLAGYKLLVEVKLARELEGFVEEPSLLEEDEVLDEAEEATEEAEVKGEKDEPVEEEAEKKTEAGELEKPYVEIKETPTGWLRVRNAPSTDATATELGQVKPGETYSYLEEEENGWYKIEFEGEPGWISGTYADLID